MLGQQVFRFSGANIYWGGLDDDVALEYPSQYRVNAALQTVDDMGGTVVRCQSCGVSTGNPLSVEPSLGTFNATALDRIDYFVAEAAKDNIRLVIPLVDSNNYYIGGYADFTDWLGLSSPSDCPSAACASQFYDNPQAIKAFEQYIWVLLNHVNIYTGIPNKDNPTIMSWETGNEMRYGLGGAPEFTQWTATISAYIKSIAPSQLVTDGSIVLDPGDLTLPDVDIADQHYYPPYTGLLQVASLLTALADKAFIVGEYEWNDSTMLEPFLSAITNNPSVSGDLYWDLLPPNDDFGFVEHFDGYQLHFPGDNSDVLSDGLLPPVFAPSSDASQVAQLRDHAYAMAGEPVPPDAVPEAPVITNVEQVDSATTGSGNIVEWQGAVGAATYVVSRSVDGPTGPWTVAGYISATHQEPWLDRWGPAGPNVWYQVTGVNPAGVAGPASAAVQMKDLTLDDNAANFSLSYKRSLGVAIDTRTPSLYDGDGARIAFWAAEPLAYAVWQAAGPIQTVEALAYYSSNTEPLQFLISADGLNWTSVPDSNVQAQPLLVGTRNDETQWIYTIDGVQNLLPGARYLTVQRSWGAAGTAELGELRMTYAPPP